MPWYPHPVAEGAGSAGPAPVLPQYLVGAYDTSGVRLVASYGGVTLTAPMRVFRAFVTGPAGTTCLLYISDQTGVNTIPDNRYLVDSTPAGNADYANFDVPLVVPAGWRIFFVWEDGRAVLGAANNPTGATARIDTQAVT